MNTMTKPKSRGRGKYPWEYDALVESERQALSLKGRRKKKAISKAAKQRERARRNREQVNQPLDAGIPKMVRPWPQGWRVPTMSRPMTAKEYARYLTLPHWQEFRDAYRASEALQECFVCASPAFELHHHTYVRLGRESIKDVVPLCDAHHRAVHKAVKAGVRLGSAHTYVKMRYQRNELDVRTRSLKI